MQLSQTFVFLAMIAAKYTLVRIGLIVRGANRSKHSVAKLRTLDRGKAAINATFFLFGLFWTRAFSHDNQCRLSTGLIV